MQTENEQLILKKAKRAEYSKIYQLKNKAKISEYNKIYTEKNKAKKIEYDKKNKVKITEYQKEYRKNNKHKNSDYLKNKRQTDPFFKLKHNLRTRINSSLKAKNYIKSQRTIEMIGCDLKTIKAHLEKQFTKGMNWENQGEWHIDHIIPCASAKTEEALIKLFHYTNLQPLWAIDNILKKDKIIEKQLFLL